MFLAECAGCEMLTTRKPSDNAYDTQVLCVVCYADLEHLMEHTRDECPGDECPRDHAEEEHWDRDCREHHMRAEAA